MERVPEQELMDDEHQAVAYARADFSASNQAFVDRLARDVPHGLHAALDLGCGPADVVIRLVRAMPGLHVTAVDGAAPMLVLARDAVRAAGLDRQIALRLGRLPGLALPEHAFDAVLSKDLLHHLPDPSALWSEVTRLGQPGAVVRVMDLIRSETPEAARQMMSAVVATEAPILQQDFYNSLCAAFTIEEVRAQLDEAKLDLRVEQVSERHMLISGHLPLS